MAGWPTSANDCMPPMREHMAIPGRRTATQTATAQRELALYLRQNTGLTAGIRYELRDLRLMVSRHSMATAARYQIDRRAKDKRIVTKTTSMATKLRRIFKKSSFWSPNSWKTHCKGPRNGKFQSHIFHSYTIPILVRNRRIKNEIR